MIGIKSNGVLVLLFLRVWLTTATYDFANPLKKCLSITEDPNAPLEGDAVCDTMPEATRKELCTTTAIAFCRRYGVEVEEDDTPLGKTKMYTFRLDVGMQPKSSTAYTQAACACPTKPIIYFQKSPFTPPEDATSIRILAEAPSAKLSNKRSSESSSSESGQESKTSRRSVRLRG